jgi:hypothetical protein
MTAAERRLVRLFIGIVDPFWLLVLLADFGMLAGLYVFGKTPLGPGAVAVLLLLATNFLLSRALGTLFDRLAETKLGASVLLLIVLCIAMLPGALVPVLQRNSGLRERVVSILFFTPPFAAADAMTSAESPLIGLLLLVVWLAALFGVLVWFEKNPVRARAIHAQAARWDSRYERFGALFGAANAPLVGFWLRFYLRNNRVRTFCFAGLPLAAFLAYSMGRNHDQWFIGALGAMPVLGYMGTSRIAVNQFGYTGGGFRRFFLFPSDPGAALRCASYASLLMSLPMLPLGLIAWYVIAPAGRDWRQGFMLLCAGIAGVLVFNALGLWSTLYGPRKGVYDSTMGNDLSAIGNLVLIGTMMVGLLVPPLLHHFAPALVSPDNWALAVIPAGVAYALYKISLALAGHRLNQRREELMRIVEGKL